jgi:hypothetical protein
VCCSRVSPGSDVCREPCWRREVFLRVELPGETIGPESCVFVARDSDGEELFSPVLKRDSDVYGEYRVGLTQAKVSRPAESLVSLAYKDPVNHRHTHA